MGRQQDGKSYFSDQGIPGQGQKLNESQFLALTLMREMQRKTFWVFCIQSRKRSWFQLLRRLKQEN
jgi:hypothetical protein